MTDTRLAEATQILAGEDGSLRGAERYDGMTTTLHWITAILVVTLFSLAHVWSFFPHDVRRRLRCRPRTSLSA